MNITHKLAAASVAAAGSAALLAGLLAAGPASAHQTARLTTSSTPGSGCPASAKGLLPLRPASVQAAASRAVAEAAKEYKGLNTAGAEVMAADRSAFAGPRGSEVRYLCGPAAAARTVVVQMLFPKELPSASLSQGVVFVGRFAHGYQVWYVAH